jgi:predicted phage tail protein
MKQAQEIWFVRSNGGHGSYPVTREGWFVVFGYVAGVAALAVMSVWLMTANTGPMWMWIAVFGAGMAALGYAFIITARQHTDFSVTYNEYRKRNA